MGKPEPKAVLTEGPNIKPWPKMPELPEHLLIKVCSYIDDEVTTTDELIPSGDTSSYRSNPIQMSAFTLYRRDPEYVGEAKHVQELEKRRAAGEAVWESDELKEVYKKIDFVQGAAQIRKDEIGIGSSIYARKPGDGSAREQAASCQKVLGGMANLTISYATRRYRANLINWGILPFELTDIGDLDKFQKGSYLFLPDIKKKIENGEERIDAYILDSKAEKIEFTTGALSKKERAILSAGCMINYHKKIVNV